MEHLTIFDIQIQDIIFYDQKIKQQCIGFCEKNRVDFLPSFDGLKKYTMNEKRNDLVPEDIGEDDFVDGSEEIFNYKMVKKFRARPTMFVRSHGILSGMVHFSDYNSNVVSTYLYNQLGEYEKNLRALITAEGYKMEDVIEDFENKSKNQYFRDRLDYYYPLLEKDSNGLNICSLPDLITFANEKLMVGLNFDVTKVRNQVMHHNEFVEKKNTENDTFIFDIDAFEQFIKRIHHLFEDSLKVKNTLFFSTHRY